MSVLRRDGQHLPRPAGHHARHIRKTLRRVACQSFAVNSRLRQDRERPGLLQQLASVVPKHRYVW